MVASRCPADSAHGLQLELIREVTAHEMTRNEFTVFRLFGAATMLRVNASGMKTAPLGRIYRAGHIAGEKNPLHPVVRIRDGDR